MRGLHAVGCRFGDDVNAFTANRCTQVSFDPPPLALSVEKPGRSVRLSRAARDFTVAVLPSGAREFVADVTGARWLADGRPLTMGSGVFTQKTDP